MNTLKVLVDGPCPGHRNMAIDARLLARHRTGDMPILRIYRWSPSAISCGYHQADSDFDMDRITSRGYDFVRRPTGGRAILHAQEITYAVIGSSPSMLFGDTLHGSYRTINRALLSFLGALGIKADISTGESLAEARGAICFRSAGRHEITVSGLKLIGSAQRRHQGVFLQHGSILTGPAHADLLHCLAAPPPRFSDVEDLLAETTDLGTLLGRRPETLDYGDLIEKLITAFTGTLSLDPLRGEG